MTTLVNNHVLIHDMPNMATSLPWRRRWQTEISSAVTGNESRAALRAKPRVELSWTVDRTSIPDQQSFEDRLRAALKSGFACAPFWARGQKLAADVNGTAVSFTGLSWTWSVNDYVFFFDIGAQTYNVRQLSQVVGGYVLSAGVSQTFRAGTLCWPMLFGKLTNKDLSADTPSFGGMQLTISELVSSETAQLGAVVPPAGDGIGVWRIGTTFVVGA